MSFKNCKLIGSDVDDREYHKPTAERGDMAFVMSSSALRQVFAKSPRAWRAGWSEESSLAMDLGSLVDCLVLTPQFYNSRYVTTPDEYASEVLKCPQCGSVTDAKRCNKCKVDRVETTIKKPWSNQSETCKSWVEAQAVRGIEVISSDMLAKAQAMKARLLADEQIAAVLDSSDKQVWVSGEWHDEATGLVVPVKCLIDFVEKFMPLTRQRIGDLKTTKNAALLAWASWARKAGYPVQAAWNLDLYNAATNRGIEMFEWFLVETEPPYETGRRYDGWDELLGEQDERSCIQSGRRDYRRMMANYCQCLKHDRWPGYDETDESSNGATRLTTDPWDEQRKMFAPKFDFGSGELPQQAEEQGDDVTP